jgi:dTDP-4-dehydrorhamnose 3,5-epimerase
MSVLLQDVQLINCKKVVNERGFLQEITREDAPAFFKIGQTYLTQTLKGIIKAWYLHRQQWDSIFVISGVMKIALYDTRPQSATFEQVSEHLIRAEAPQLIHIPPGVWHGFQALETHLLLLHQNSHAFDFDAPDELKKDIHSSDIPFSW